MLELGSSLRSAVGAATASALEDGFGMRVAGDLVQHYPRRYLRGGDFSDLAELTLGDHVTVVAEVVEHHIRPMKNRPGKIVEVVISDGTRRLRLTFFKQNWRYQQLRPGVRGMFAGVLSEFNKVRQLAHPTCLVLAGDDPDEPGAPAGPAVNGVRVTPVYPATSKIDSWKIALAIDTVLTSLGDIPDPMPRALRESLGLLPYAEALRRIHRPATLEEVAEAKSRLKWDEALQLQVALAQRRAADRTLPAVPRPERSGGLLEAFDVTLPYDLTAGQVAVGGDIFDDLAQDLPMNRLLAGEVGSGKTVVALRAMLAAVDAGGQAAFLAPTEVLAGQHLHSLRALLGPLGIAGELGAAPEATRVELLTGSLAAARRRGALAAAADGSAGIVVGTHALLSEGVEFADLALVVVDEQHRFGVEQRAALRQRGRAGTAPHVLVMTATPIPRTVAMTVFGDLETSVLTELPRGRQPVATFVVPGDNPRWTERMWSKIRDEVAAGRQAYVVCPRISGDDLGDIGAERAVDLDAPPPATLRETAPKRPLAAVEEVTPLLADGELFGLRVDMLHGSLSAERKEAVMTSFAAREIDVLIATTVVEVGVDVPNATVMVVLDADRFGISQLHQLRGRIGRGIHESTCLLHTALTPPSPAYERLTTVAGTMDGAALARADLTQRGEGDVLGAAQHGVRSRLRLLRLLEDEDIVVAARRHAQDLVAHDPELSAEPALAAAVAALRSDVSYLEKG